MPKEAVEQQDLVVLKGQGDLRVHKEPKVHVGRKELRDQEGLKVRQDH